MSDDDALIDAAKEELWPVVEAFYEAIRTVARRYSPSDADALAMVISLLQIMSLTFEMAALQVIGDIDPKIVEIAEAKIRAEGERARLALREKRGEIYHDDVADD